MGIYIGPQSFFIEGIIIKYVNTYVLTVFQIYTYVFSFEIIKQIISLNVVNSVILV